MSKKVTILTLCMSLFLSLSLEPASVTAKTIIPAAKIAQTASASKITAKTVIPKTQLATASPNVQPASVIQEAPYTSQLKALKSLPSNIINAWQELYQIYQKNAPKTSSKITLTSAQKAALLPLFSTNFFSMIENYTNAKNFPPLSNDPESAIHTSYATNHINKTAARLASISSIDFSKDTPTVQFAGDNRDLGIIVNIQNNSQAQFSISQNSLDGTQSTQIGLLVHGLNAVNLHTAALQAPEPKNGPGTVSSNPAKISKTKQESKSLYYFELQELDADNPTTISLKIMSGTDLITFLKTLPRSAQAIKKDTFEMNGLPTSPEYLANPKDYYLVLIQNPTPSTAQKRNPDQRIQAINISKFTGPYLLTMQINPFTVEIPAKPDEANGEDMATATTQAESFDIFQPSINYVHILNNPTIQSLNIPTLLFPHFLTNLSQLESLWILLNTTQIATLTNFKFFGENTFANAYEYFNHLNCFKNQQNYAFFIDLYNRFKPDYIVYNAPWLMANGIYETNLAYCSDIIQIYTAQDPYGHATVNEQNFYYVNFITMCIPQNRESSMETLFHTQGFNITYAIPKNQLYSFVVNAIITDIKEGIFGTLTEKDTGVYHLTWTNKKNQIINSKTLYLNTPISNIKIAFANLTTNWIGSSVPTELIQLTPGKTTHFKVTYEYNPTNNKHILLTQTTSPIDKQEVFLPLQFSHYPINELYVDLFHACNIDPFIRCFIIKNGVLPAPLTMLTQQDWQSGIYMVPIIANNKNLNSNNPGSFTAMFYKADKTYLGEITIDGQVKNTTEIGIKETINYYTIHFSELNCLRSLYLSTGVLLRYNDVQ